MANASPRSRLLLRIGGRAAAVSLIALLSSVLFAATPAAACDVLDPTCVDETVEETVDSPTGTVDDAAGSPDQIIDETVEETTEPVDETVEETTETVESVIGQADETVDKTVGPGIGPVDDGIGDPSVPGVDPDPVPPPTVDGPSEVGGGGGASGGNGSDAGDQPAGTSNGGVAGPFVLDPFTLGGAPAVESTPAPRGFLDVLAGPAGEIARRIAFPLALALLVFLFLVFQHRLDGRDPKLALATTSPDVLRFG
jgi:hypothetical protein